MSESEYAIRYPRNQAARNFLRAAGRFAIPLLSRLEVRGKESFPKQGPLIVVGNHVAVMEVALMAIFAPWQVEMLGVGDIPVEPGFAPLVNAFGYIPIQRGKFDRKALGAALEVLRQGGVVGIFPEGGIWATEFKQAHNGVAWLSYHGQAPLLPVGFGGMQGALAKMLRLQRPKMLMNIGRVIPPVQAVAGQPLKVTLEQAAQAVMAQVEKLVPEDDSMRRNRVVDERFDLTITARDAAGQVQPAPARLALRNAAALSKLLYTPVLINTFERNLSLPVGALKRLRQRPAAVEIRAAAEAILAYLERDNPYFLTYRFGYELGAAMQTGLRELGACAAWATEQGLTLEVTPIRRYYLPGLSQEVVETSPEGAHAL